MFIIILIILAIFALSGVEHNFAVGFVLSGLLGVVWVLYARLTKLTERLNKLESSLLKSEQVPSAEIVVSRVQASEKPSHAPPVQTKNTPEKPETKIVDDGGFELELDDDADELFTVQKVFDEIENAPSSQALLARANNSASTISSPPSSVQPERAKSFENKRSPNSTSKSRGHEPQAPRVPALVDKLIAAAWGWVSSGNVFVRVGIIVLFMGMTFLTRYAIGQNIIPIELRLIAISAVAIALLFWGWKQRASRQNFSLVVQGGGIGLLYLTIFAGFSLYKVIPSTVAFVLLALIVVLAGLLAVKQDAKPLALFATVGGFLAPVLTSSGSNNYVGLFSYYSLLNIGIFFVAWFKSWRILNFVGFIFTFLISTVWGVLSYEKEFFATTEPFLILYFLLYVAIGILFAHKRTEFYKDYVDSSLIFGTPIFAFSLQCAMVKDTEYGVAISAAVLGVFYLVLATLLWKKYGKRLRLLSETFLSLGAIFTTLAIPFAIDGHLSGAAWAIEGTGILWVSIKQQQKYRRFFGIALIFAASAMLAYGLESVQTSSAFINSFFIGCVIIMLAGTLASWLLSQEFSGKTKVESGLSNALLVYAVLAVLFGFEVEVTEFGMLAERGSILALMCGLIMLGYTLLASKLAWPKANWVSVGFVLPMCSAAVQCFTHQTQVADFYGWLLWPLVLVVCFYGLKKAQGVVNDKALMLAHVLTAMVIAGLLLWDGVWQLMLAYSVFAIAFNYLGNRLDWPQLKVLALGFFPVLVVCSYFAIAIDGDLVTLSNVSGTIRPPFPPGFVLWPFGFVVYFYLLNANRQIGGDKSKYLHYAGAALIAALLLWLGLAPLLLGASLLSIVFCSLWQKFDWPEMREISMALLPLMVLTALAKIVDGSFHVTALTGLGDIPISESGFFLWPLAFLALGLTYRAYDNRQQSAPAIFQAGGLVLLSVIVSWEVSWHLLDHFALLNAWHLAWLPIFSMLILWCVFSQKVWPFSMHLAAYKQFAVPVFQSGIVAWSLWQLTSSANSFPLPWLPIANPIDVVQVLIMLGALYWREHLVLPSFMKLSAQQLRYSIAAYAFVWANVEILRAVHHWTGVSWQLPAIISADVSQTSMALFWALGGLVLTTYASKRQARTWWFIGGALLVAVVMKLFLIDLSAQDTIERIISFTGVGLLLVAVGYFSPIPPKTTDGEKVDEEKVDEVTTPEQSEKNKGETNV